MIYLGVALRQYRQKQELTPEEFAERVFISKGYLDKLESTSLRTRKALSCELCLQICEEFKDASLYDQWTVELNNFIERERQQLLIKVS